MAASKAIGFLNFKFSADLTSFERAMKKAQKGLTKFGKNIQKTGQNLSRNLTLPILALGAASIKAFDQQAKAETKLLAALKGREDVQKRLIEQAKELQKTTLFGDEETIAAQSMLAMMGLQEEEILKLTPLIQDFAAAKGMDLVTAADLVAKSMGSSTNALSRYGIEITGAVGSSERLDTAVGALTDKFEGQAAAAAGVGAGPLIQMKNQLGDLGEELGGRLMPYIKEFVDWIVGLIGKFDNLSESTKDNIVQWGLILAAIGPVLIIVGKMSVGLGSLIGGFKKLAKWIVANPYLALAGAITLIVAQVARLIIQYDGLTSSQRAINNLNQTAASQILKQKTEVERLTDVLKDENTALEDKEIALKKLQGISPTYYGNMTAATLNVKQLDTATKDYISTLLTQAKIEAGQNLLVGLMEEQIQLSAEIAEANEEVSTGQMLLNIGKAIIMPGDALANQVNDYKDLKRFNELQKDITAITDLINTEEKKQQKQRETAATYEFKEIGSGDGDGGNAQEKLDSAQDTTIDKMENVTLALDDGTDAAKGLYGEFKKLEKTKPFEPLGELDKFAGSLGIFGDEMAIFFGTNIEAIESGLESMVTTLGDNLAQGAESFGEYAENVKGILRDIIGGLISSGVAAAVSKAITDAAFLPVWAIPVVAGAAAGLARTAFNTLIPEFAAGGLVTGPTTALIGEGSGTSMANPEVVAPLDKLKQYMGGGQNVTVQGRLVGSDIYLSNERTKFNRNRTV